MHELSITRSILEICAERAAGARICRVTVEVGTLTCVRPEALRFCFEACAEGTPLAGAELEIVTIRGRARCRGCGLEAARDDLLTACACGSFDLEYTAGEELRIREMEVREPPIESKRACIASGPAEVKARGAGRSRTTAKPSNAEIGRAGGNPLD